MIEELDRKDLCNICKNNQPAAQPTPKDAKPDLIYKWVFCDFT